jgi:hypothetical protein
MKQKNNPVVYVVVYKMNKEIHGFQKRGNQIVMHDHYTTAVKAVKKLNAKLDAKNRHWVAVTNLKLQDHSLIIW